MALYSMRNAALRSLTIVSRSVRSTWRIVPERFVACSGPRMERALEELRDNPYFEKYSEKIARLQQTSPEEFLQRVEERERMIREKEERRQREREPYAGRAKASVEPGSTRREARLDDIVRTDLIANRSTEEIERIWREYHRERDCIAATMTPEQFDGTFDRAGRYPTFVLPLPRERGYEFVLSQFDGREVHMTPLLWYQTHKENAPECLTMVHYTELRESKGLVLMRGEFDAKYMNAREARCLADELQLYYSTDDPHRLRLLETFTERPDEFKHMDLIAQLETISLETCHD